MYLQDGRILSGGNDARLCLWSSEEAVCTELAGHNSNISKVMVDDNNIAITAGYDAQLLCWNLDDQSCKHGMMGGH